MSKTPGMISLGIRLMVIAGIAAGLLSVVYQFTQPLIAAQERTKVQGSLAQVFPLAGDFEERQVDDLRFFAGKKDGSVIGYVVPVEANGYGGPIRMMVGVDRAGTITGVSVLDHRETPGLGSNITQVKYGEQDPWFLTQFKGKNATTVTLAEVQAITGATISSRAVAHGIREQISRLLPRIIGAEQ